MILNSFRINNKRTYLTISVKALLVWDKNFEKWRNFQKRLHSIYFYSSLFVVSIVYNMSGKFFIDFFLSLFSVFINQSMFIKIFLSVFSFFLNSLKNYCHFILFSYLFLLHKFIFSPFLKVLFLLLFRT